MKFIVLIGKDNTGKTKTLKCVIDELLKKGASIVDVAKLHKFGSNIKSVSEWPVKQSHEATIVLEYKGEKIGITTYGDTRDVLSRKIDIFISIECTCIIFGSHPGGSSYEYLVELAENYNFKDFHAIFKIGCAGITGHQNLQKLQNDSDLQAKNEILSLIN